MEEAKVKTTKKALKTEDGTTTVDAMGYTKPMAMPMRRALRARRQKAKKTGNSYLKGKFESKKPVKEAFNPKEGWKYRKPGPSGREQGAGSSYEHPKHGTIVKSFKGSGYVHFPKGADKTSHKGTFKTPEEAMIHAIGYHKAAYGT